MAKEETLTIQNEVNAANIQELSEELKAMRYAFGILFTQLTPAIKSGIIYQLSESEADSAKRMAQFLSQFKDMN